MKTCHIKALGVFFMLLTACTNSFCQNTIPNIPSAASCFPTATVSKLSVIQKKIVSANEQLITTTDSVARLQSINSLIAAANELSMLYDTAVAGITSSEEKKIGLSYKRKAEEQLVLASSIVLPLSLTDTNLNAGIKTAYDKVLQSINELDSAFAKVNPCPKKGQENYYTDNNGKRQINLSMVNRFKQVWNETNAPLTYDNYTYQSKERRLFAWTEVSQLWENYRFAQTIKQDTATGISPESKVEPDIQLAAKTETDKGNYRLGELRNAGDSDSGRSGKIKDLTTDKSPVTAGGKKPNQAASPAERKREATASKTTGDIPKANISESKKTITAYASGTLSADFFTVQIAANTKPLDTILLRVLYKGAYTIEERLEDGWYRYVVGRFFDVNSAVSHLNSSIEVGMVTAYKGNTRTIVTAKSHATQSLSTSKGVIAVYRVQIAAAKKPVSAKLLHSLYSGIRPINVNSEDGWFRYSIGDYLLYDDAISVRDSSGVPGAFVMPYINGVRQSVKGRMEIHKEEVKRTTNPVFVVQLAATKRPISLRKLKVYRKSGIPVTLRIEDGWYKYTTDVFFSKDLARKRAQEIKVSGAFVVTYMNGKRVNP